MTSASTFSKTDEQSQAVAGLPQRPFPDLARDHWLYGRQPALDEVTVLMSPQALAQIDEYGRSDLYRELGGTLLGHAYRSEGVLVVEVAAALPATSSDHGPVHFTFTADAWAQLQQDREANYPDLETVGWFHTHPGLGVFYSGDDVVVHSAALTLPWHVGLVVDPMANEACFFGWIKGHLTPLSGFYEKLLDAADQPSVPWRVVETSVWDRPYTEADYQQAQSSGVYAHPNRAGISAASPSLGLIVGLLGLFLTIFMLLGWVVPLTQQVDRLEGVVLQLADAGLAASNAQTCPDPRLRLLAPRHDAAYTTGSNIPLLGTADLPEIRYYKVQYRPADGETWTEIDTRRSGTNLGELAVWNTDGVPAGAYLIRVTAVDRQGLTFSNTPDCFLQLYLEAAP